jgi:hypothetical protein
MDPFRKFVWNHEGAVAVAEQIGIKARQSSHIQILGELICNPFFLMAPKP